MSIADILRNSPYANRSERDDWPECAKEQFRERRDLFIHEVRRMQELHEQLKKSNVQVRINTDAIDRRFPEYTLQKLNDALWIQTLLPDFSVAIELK